MTLWSRKKPRHIIVLGRKHQFSDLERKELSAVFSDILCVKYCERDPLDVIFEIDNHIKTNDVALLVLNTMEKVDDLIVRYLTKLQFHDMKRKFRVLGVESFLEKYLKKCYIPDDSGDLSFLENIGPFSKLQYMQKRFIDFFGLFWLFFFGWPVLLLCVLKIKRQSPGDILYSQERVGYKNKEFVCVKFRSMRMDAEKDGAQFAKHGDSRVFPWGATMRKTRFDELPQMINILKGEMHLIGPRPERRIWTNEFEKRMPYYAERHLVRPGVTGLAQVMYPYGENTEDAKQKLMYDLYYIKYWSFWLEMKIVWLTALTVIGKKGV